MKVRVKFKKYGVMKFIGHLDVMRYFQKALRRADIPVAFTKGFSPHMVMSFANPLGVGLTSDGEYFDLEITRPLSTKEAVKRLNEVMVEGMEVLDFVEISGDKKSTGMSIVAAADYLVTDKDGKMDDAFFDGLSNILQVLKIPSEFIQMLPYLATIAGLTVYSIQKSAAASRKMKKIKEVQG